jgi:hypothetical protein
VDGAYDASPGITQYDEFANTGIGLISRHTGQQSTSRLGVKYQGIAGMVNHCLWMAYGSAQTNIGWL